MRVDQAATATTASWPAALAGAADPPAVTAGDDRPVPDLDSWFGGDRPGAGLLRQNLQSLGGVPGAPAASSGLPPDLERAVDAFFKTNDERLKSIAKVPDPGRLRPQLVAALKFGEAAWVTLKDPASRDNWLQAVFTAVALANAADPKSFGGAKIDSGLLDKILAVGRAEPKDQTTALAAAVVAALRVSPNPDVKKAAGLVEGIAATSLNKEGEVAFNKAGLTSAVAAGLRVSDNADVRKAADLVESIGKARFNPNVENLAGLASAIVLVSDDPNARKAATAVQGVAAAYAAWTSGNPAGYAGAALAILGLIEDRDVQNGVSVASSLLAIVYGGPVGWVAGGAGLIQSLVSIFGGEKEKWQTKEFTSALDLSGDGVPDRLGIRVSTKKNHQWIYEVGAAGVPVQRARFALTAAADGGERWFLERLAGGKLDVAGMPPPRDEGRPFYHLDLDVDFASINPSVGGANGKSGIDLTPERHAALVAALGATAGEFVAGDPRIEGVLRPYLDGIGLRYESGKANPDIWLRADVDGDGAADLIREGSRIDGLRNQGDGLFTVIRLGAVEGHGHAFTIDRLEDAPIVALTGPALLAYGASYPDLIRSFGPDAGALYRHYRDHGQAEGRGVTFDPAAWLAARPDVAAATGGDSWSAIGTYIVEQKARLDSEALAARPVALAVRDGALALNDATPLGPGFEPRVIVLQSNGEYVTDAVQGFQVAPGQAQRIEAIIAGAPAIAANDPRWSAIRDALATPSPVPVAAPAEQASFASGGY